MSLPFTYLFLRGDVIFSQTTMAWVREKLFVVSQHPMNMRDPRSLGLPVGKVSLTLVGSGNFGGLKMETGYESSGIAKRQEVGCPGVQAASFDSSQCS
jgi:hypothetical protein